MHLPIEKKEVKMLHENMKMASAKRPLENGTLAAAQLMSAFMFDT